MLWAGEGGFMTIVEHQPENFRHSAATGLPSSEYASHEARIKTWWVFLVRYHRLCRWYLSIHSVSKPDGSFKLTLYISNIIYQQGLVKTYFYSRYVIQFWNLVLLLLWLLARKKKEKKNTINKRKGKIMKSCCVCFILL